MSKQQAKKIRAHKANGGYYAEKKAHSAAEGDVYFLDSRGKITKIRLVKHDRESSLTPTGKFLMTKSVLLEGFLTTPFVLETLKASSDTRDAFKNLRKIN